MGCHWGPVAQTTFPWIRVSPFHPLIAAILGHIRYLFFSEWNIAECLRTNAKMQIKGKVSRLHPTQNYQARSRTNTGLRSTVRWLRDREPAQGCKERLWAVQVPCRGDGSGGMKVKSTDDPVIGKSPWVVIHSYRPERTLRIWTK